MSRHETRGGDTWVFAAADFAATIGTDRHLITRGQRFRADDPVVTARPDLFRAFIPPPTGD